MRPNLTDMARPSAGSRPWDDLGQKLMMFGCLGTKQLGAVYHSHDGSMVLLYMVTFTINIPQMLAYIPYMDPMGLLIQAQLHNTA